MHDNRWPIWIALIVLFLVFRGVRAVFRTMRGDGTPMARTNAAAKRMLAQQQSARSQIPTTAKSNPHRPGKIAGRPDRAAALKKAAPQKALAPQGGSAAILGAARTPAVTRRAGLLGGREPVVQRRR